MEAWMSTAPLGDLELEVLRFVSEAESISVREAAERFGEPRELALTTIQTVMERLRKKGYLRRKKQSGVFQYSPSVPQEQVIGGVVQSFVEKTLGGSVSPLLAYIAKARDLRPEEMEELRRLVEAMDDKPEDTR
jgi:predicted transcriptional regulator